MGTADPPTYANAFGIADETAAWGQRTHLRLTRLELGLLVLAAASGLVSTPVGDRDIDLGGLLAVILFALTLALRAYRMSTRPTRTWQDARAAAESIKTLCWKYAAGSRLFPPDLDAAAADRLFVERLRDVLGALRELPTVQRATTAHEEITPWMRALRAAPLDERRTVYERERLEDQQRWYAGKSAFNQRQSQRWGLVVLGLEFVGVVVGAVKAFGLLSSGSRRGRPPGARGDARGRRGGLGPGQAVRDPRLGLRDRQRGARRDPRPGPPRDRRDRLGGVRRLGRDRDLPRAHHVARLPTT